MKMQHISYRSVFNTQLPAMFKNYLKTAFRNLLHNHISNLITIIGFSIGLAFVILITIFIKNEWSYDQFHPNKKNLYRITGVGTDDKGNVFKSGNTKALIAPLLTDGIAAIQKSCRTDGGMLLVKKKDDVISAMVTEVDSSFFEMFGFQLLQGNRSTILRAPDEAVITDEIALRIFGSLNVIGQIIEIEKGKNFIPFRITAIAKKAPDNSTIWYDIIIPIFNSTAPKTSEELASSWVNTFVSTVEQAGINAIGTEISKRYNEYSNNTLQAKALIKYNYQLQPITDMHLNEEFYVFNGLRNGSSKTYSYILGGIAFFILLIACINFINLALVRAMKRSKEIGIRKVSGSTKTQLVVQFLMESVLIGILAIIPAIIIMSLLLPSLSSFVKMEIHPLSILDISSVTLIVLLIIVTGLLAGAYPAFVLSSFRPIQALAGKIKLSGKNIFSKSLIVFQFMLAIFLIICTLTMKQQFQFISSHDLGYKTTDIAVVKPDRKADKKIVSLLQTEVENMQGVGKTTITDWSVNNTKFTVDGAITDWCSYQPVDAEFTGVFGIRILLGRNFFSFGTADTSSCLVNEKFVQAMNWQDAIGKQIGYRNKILTVIGVVADYNNASLTRKINPLVLMRRDSSQYGQLFIQYQAGSLAALRPSILDALKRMDPWHKAEITVMNDLNAQRYDEEKSWASIINFSAIIAITLSCLGLLGLSAVNISQRLKEIGIRKVVGANTVSIVILMVKEFVKLVIIGSVIAAPIGWWVMSKWLQGFEYRIEMQWWLFVLAAVFALLIALLTIGVQTVKAAMRNPVKSLRAD